ncbi:ATP-dependent DNA helicase [Trichonephila clavipes]|nr:ATP-dependent DNA helicase [Trichonephila clavipes]
MEIYNRYTNNDGYCHTYITCASTGKAAVAISGTTVHTDLNISLLRLLPLHSETAQQCRTLFKYIKVIIIDEIRNFSVNYHQFVLRPSISNRNRPSLDQFMANLKFYEPNEIMRHANPQFSLILTKIGNGEQLDEIEITLIKSRFCTVEEAKLSDEAHFWLNSYVNKQNCRIWSEANPQVYVETPLHPEKLTVWCTLWADGIIGPYFFKNDEGHNVTVNGDRYRAMITNFFIPELNNHDVQELWF